MEKSKFVKRKVEETTSFVPGEEKEAFGGCGGGGRCLRLAPVRHDLYSGYTCAFDLERIWGGEGGIEFLTTGDSASQRYE